MTLYRMVKPKRYSDQVFEQLRDLIFRGQLKPGDKLLPERELAQSMGVSRPTVREAINKLVYRGMLEHRQGQGTFVAMPEPGQAHNPFKAMIEGYEATPLDLLEVRLGLECNAAVLAARRATPEDLAMLEKSFHLMRDKILEGELGLEEDVAFHMCIAYSTKNQVQIHIMRYLYDMLHYGIKESLQHLYEKPANLRDIINQHERVYEAIRRHDTQEAFDAMRVHIGFVIDFIANRYPDSPSKVSIKLNGGSAADAK